MDQQTAKRVIVLFLVVGGGLNAARTVRAGKADEVPRVLVGIGIATLSLSLMAEIKAVTHIAGMLAVTALTVSILSPGLPDLILAALGEKPK